MLATNSKRRWSEIWNVVSRWQVARHDECMGVWVSWGTKWRSGSISEGRKPHLSVQRGANKLIVAFVQRSWMVSVSKAIRQELYQNYNNDEHNGCNNQPYEKLWQQILLQHPCLVLKKRFTKFAATFGVTTSVVRNLTSMSKRGDQKSSLTGQMAE